MTDRYNNFKHYYSYEEMSGYFGAKSRQALEYYRNRYEFETHELGGRFLYLKSSVDSILRERRGVEFESFQDSETKAVYTCPVGLVRDKEKTRDIDFRIWVPHKTALEYWRLTKMRLSQVVNEYNPSPVRTTTLPSSDTMLYHILDLVDYPYTDEYSSRSVLGLISIEPHMYKQYGLPNIGNQLRLVITYPNRADIGVCSLFGFPVVVKMELDSQNLFLWRILGLSLFHSGTALSTAPELGLIPTPNDYLRLREFWTE